MEAATQDNSSGTWRLGFLHLARQKAWILDHEEARGDIRRESAGAEAGVGAVVWLPLQFSQWIWGARLAEHRARAPSAPGQSGRAPPQPRSSPGPSGHALLPSLAHEQWMVPLEASSSPRKGWFLIDPQAPPALRVTPSPLGLANEEERLSSAVSCVFCHVTGCSPPSDLRPPEAQGPPTRVPLPANRRDCPQVSPWHLGLCSLSGPGGRARRPQFTGHRLELRLSVHQELGHVTLPRARARLPEPGLPAPPSVR